MSNQYFTLPSVGPNALETITLFSLPTSTASDVRRAATALAISRLATVPVDSLACVETVLMCLCFGIADAAPQLTSMTSLAVQVVPLTASDVNNFLEEKQIANQALSARVQQQPPLYASMVVNSIEGVYAALASLLFAIGKQGGSGAEANSVKGRPAALISRFKISGDDQALLPDREFGPSQATIEMIYNSFSTFTEPRMKVVHLFLAYAEQHGHLSRDLEIMMTNFRLLRGAGQTHVDAILKGVNMHPWLIRVPELSPYFSHFVEELGKFQQVPIRFREYHRLLVPQSEFLFVSSEYKPLIAVVGSYVSEVEKSFEGYVYHETEFSKLISKVKSFEPGRTTYVGATAVLQALGIPDMAVSGNPRDTIDPKKVIE